MKRMTIIILDSVGCGAAPDAALYGDEGCNTLAHIAEAVPDLRLPNLAELGLGHIPGTAGIPLSRNPAGNYGRMQEQSPGKDTTTGHWELAGIRLTRPFPVYPDGFPPEIVSLLEQAFNRSILGNIPASGTEIINQLGDEHVRTGFPIVYTSADSVLQIAAHESVIPLEQLYLYCRLAREIMQGEHAVGRIIARPFSGSSGLYQRTVNRHDFSLEPPEPTILDCAVQSGLTVTGIGKINDIYTGRGVTRAIPTKSNQDGIEQTIAAMRESSDDIIMTNLVDFDMLYGHRNDPRGYADALMQFDHFLPDLLKETSSEDLMIITADHGCDPTFPGTDHTREYVPLLTYSPAQQPGQNLGTRACFCDLAATIADYFELKPWPRGAGFYQKGTGKHP
jgi:phosphopentomutase